MPIEDLKSKAMDNLKSRFNLLNICHLYKYSSIKAQLLHLGYNLTSDDKESAFIEIITKSDPEEISLLEKYLEVFDKVQENCTLLKKYKKFFKDLETEENPNQVYKAFIANFS